MEFLYISLALIVGLAAGYFISKYLDRCPHNWELLEQGNINHYPRTGEKRLVGFFKTYECNHCKEMKTVKSQPLSD